MDYGKIIDILAAEALTVFKMEIRLEEHGMSIRAGVRNSILKDLTGDRFDEVKDRVAELTEKYKVEEFCEEVIKTIAPLEEGDEMIKTNVLALREVQNED